MPWWRNSRHGIFILGILSPYWHIYRKRNSIYAELFQACYRDISDFRMHHLHPRVSSADKLTPKACCDPALSAH